MKIGIVQIQPLKGKVDKNIKNHLWLIEHEITLNADVIIFPELSITGYEPQLAKELAKDIENNMFNSFQELWNKNKRQYVDRIGLWTS